MSSPDLSSHCIDPSQPYGQHIGLYCVNHPDLRWHTKNIDFIGARTVFYTEFSGECECPLSDLRPLSRLATHNVWYAAAGCLPDGDGPVFSGTLDECEEWVRTHAEEYLSGAEHDTYSLSIEQAEDES